MMIGQQTGPQQMMRSAGWADAGTIIPWTLYLAYGDTRILDV